MRKAILLVFSFALLPALACDSSTSVESTKTPTELSESDLSTICEDTATSMADMADLACVLSAGFSSIGAGMEMEDEEAEPGDEVDAVELCQQTFDACVSAMNANTSAFIDESQARCDSITADELFGPNCTGTVGEYEACLDAMVSTTSAMVDAFSCDASDSEATASADGSVPAACVTWEEKGCEVPTSSQDASSSEGEDL